MIRLSLSTRSVDDIPSRLIVATFFSDVRPLRGAAEWVDWRLNGRVSRLIRQGKLNGDFGESLMMPSMGRLGSREVLLFGLGPSVEMNEHRLEQSFNLLVEKILKLKPPELVISLGDLAKDFMNWRALLRFFVMTLALNHPREDMAIFCSEDPRWIREARRRNMDFGPDVMVEYEPGPAEELVA